MNYYFNKSLKGNFEEVIVKVTEELEKEGFGVLTEINVTETLKKSWMWILETIAFLEPVTRLTLIKL